MRIAVDARWITPQASGIGTYTRGLIEGLAGLDGRHRLVLLFDDRVAGERILDETGLGGHPRIERARVPYGPFSARSQIALPATLRRLRIDVFHSTNFMMPLRPARLRPRTIVTIHDPIPLLFPDAAPRSKKTRLFPLYVGLMRAIARRADRVVTDSEASRRDLVRCLDLSSSEQAKMRTIYCGVGTEFRPAPARDDDPARIRSILHVGRDDPHKNLPGLIEAFAWLRDRVPFATRLDLVGPHGAGASAATEIARRLGVEAAVVRHGNVAERDLVRAYQDADVLCLPSRYEGFGLPVVEAMASGTPVVCSRAGALPEVAGDAALLVDPDDPSALASALTRVLTDRATARALAERGLARARDFSWRRTAARTLALYEELAAPADERTSRSGRSRPAEGRQASSTSS